MRNRKNLQRLNEEAGFALVVGMLILVLLTALALSAIYNSTIETQITGNEKTGRGALIAADGGLEQALGVVWFDSGFGEGAKVSFTGMDAYFAELKTASSMDIQSNALGGGYYYDVKAVKYNSDDATKRTVTFQSTGWNDLNGDSQWSAGEPAKAVRADVEFTYIPMDFPFGVLSQNLECLLCHAQINGDVVSLNRITIRKELEAFSVINGKLKTMGKANLAAPNKDSNGVYADADSIAIDLGGHPDKDGDGKFYPRVVSNYTDGNGDYSTLEGSGETALEVTEEYTDPRFPVDENGNPKWPEIESSDYYLGLAENWKDKAGSSVKGGVIKGVPAGSTYPGGAATLTSVSKTYAGNLILDGTTSCIEIDGPIVVDKDVIIKGCIKGQGNIYAGGNIFMAGAVTYNNASEDKLALAAGGNVVMGDYRMKTVAATGGGDFIDKQIKDFNTAMRDNTVPAAEKRYYLASDGTIPVGGNPSTIDPATVANKVGYTMDHLENPSDKWMNTTDYVSSFLDNTKGITQIDALVYTSNAIFGINKVGNKKTTINGILSSADIGLLVPGPDGKATTYDPTRIGLTLNYDDRLRDFLTVARNPSKKVVSWKETKVGP